jgi:hypothetical protein
MKRFETQRWRALEGMLFTLQPLAPHSAQESWSVTLRLEGVRDLGTRGPVSAPLPCYSLVFSQQAPERAFAPQGTYRLDHPELGSQELFLVPLGPSPRALMTYEIILN